MAAFLTFFGPDGVSQIKAIDASGTEVARFMVETKKKSSFNILRIVGPGTAPMPICTTTHKASFFSGTTTFQVHNQEVEFQSTSEGLGNVVYKLKTPAGKMKWRTSGSFSTSKFELVDEAKLVIAKANTKEMRLEVLVTADEMMLDFLLTGWVALVKEKNADSEGLKAAADIVGVLAGGGGGG